MNASAKLESRAARILIVDDEPDNREVLELVLEWEGFVIATAGNGPEALAAVAKDPPDLILLDVMMPGMTGYEVVATLKANAATKHIPVMMVSALSDRDAREVGLRAGADDYLAKPVDRAELLVRVGDLLRKTLPGGPG